MTIFIDQLIERSRNMETNSLESAEDIIRKSTILVRELLPDIADEHIKMLNGISFTSMSESLLPSRGHNYFQSGLNQLISQLEKIKSDVEFLQGIRDLKRKNEESAFQ